MTNQERVDFEFIWFDENRDQIIRDHRGEWVAVRDHEVKGYFPNPVMGMDFMERQKRIAPGDFILQRCLPREEDVIHCFTPGIQIV